MKASLITTVFNEEQTMRLFLESVFKQTRFLDEVIIVDGGSTDGTIEQIIQFKSLNVNKTPNIKLIIKKGNRSVGRNEAISKAQNSIIAITDAGCILDKNWLKSIIEPFSNQKIDVVAGYYRGTAKNIFQKCLIPYVLVMEDKIKEVDFLPATRSMAIKKSVWKRAGKFDEKLSHNEDYAFANKLKKIGANIVFQKKAIVNWIPRINLKQAFVMFFRFALGDVEAKIFRDKVVYIFLRYAFAAYLFALSIIMKSYFLWGLYALLIVAYLAWSTGKNYRYVNNIKAVLYLPVLQVTSDCAVMLGTILGLVKQISLRKFLKLLLNNKGPTLIILVYIMAMLSVISWGIPNISHPFPYHMDEWHQSQSVRDLFKYGTSNIAGAANGTIFQFFLTGIYLIPFYVFGIVNPFAIKSSVTNLDLQQRLFEVLRMNTLLFGIMSVILVYYLSRKYFKSNGFITACLFTTSPIWLMLSNYFKYDIFLVFWILLSLLFLLRYISSPKTLNFVLAGIVSGLAFSVKVSAIPLFPAYVLMFFLYTSRFIGKLKVLLIGILAFITTIIFFGIPDIIFGKGNMLGYLQSNLVDVPKTMANNFNFGMNYWLYYLSRIYPITFGTALYVSFFISVVGLAVFFVREIKHSHLRKFLQRNKNYLFFVIVFVLFVLSLYPLGIGALGNRVLVLLPFMAITVGMFLTKLLSVKRMLAKLLIAFVILMIVALQSFQSYKYFKLKFDINPRVVSSEWILKNIKPNTTIGIESIPIYQFLPDIIVKDFYSQQYGLKTKPKFSYRVISFKDKFPKIVIVTNDVLESDFWLQSDKVMLVEKLQKEGYKIVKRFEPDSKYFPSERDRFDFTIAALVPFSAEISVYEK